MDYGYPNIASTGINPNEKECIIGLNYTSAVDSNGIGCYYMSNNQIYSDMNLLKKGEAPIDILSGSTDRWGDYFGIQRLYNEPCRVWMSGMFGKVGSNGSWISSIAVSDTCRSPDPVIITPVDPSTVSGILFPNPTIDWINFDFTLNETMMVEIELFDLQGRLIKELYHDTAKKGQNRLTFDGYYLKSGTYFIRISNSNQILFTKKLIKAK